LTGQRYHISGTASCNLANCSLALSDPTCAYGAKTTSTVNCLLGLDLVHTALFICVAAYRDTERKKQ
jgi:hypothetical protein